MNEKIFLKNYLLELQKLFIGDEETINNPLKKKSDLAFWVNSRAYNHVENVHQIWLLSLVDLIIGRSKYSANRK